MEIQVKEIISQPIDWNYEEIKKELEEELKKYKNLVFTEENEKDGKDTRALLNKVSKAINDRKIEIKKQYIYGYEVFENQVKELLSMINEVNYTIDYQLKEMDERKKKEKHTKLADYFKEHSPLPKEITFESIFNSKWLNSSVSYENAVKEMKATFINISNDIETIKSLNSTYEALLFRAYYENHSLNYVMSVKNDLDKWDNQKSRSESDTVVDVIQVTNQKEEPEIDDFPYEMSYTLCATQRQYDMINAYLRKLGVEYEAL